MTQQAAPIPVIPFTQAAHEHVEPFTQVISATTTTTAQVFETVVPSYGYLRSIFIEVVGAGGTGGTNQADAPFNLFDAITLLDTNGAPIFGPLDGFATLQVNQIGGYSFQNNPRNSPWYSATAPNFTFGFRVPVEIQHTTGLGSLANQNAAAAYKLRFTINPTATVWSAAPSPLPTFTIRPQLEAWSLPNETDALGRPQAQVPPNHGTIQYWSTSNPSVAVGNNNTQITRVGNLIRNLLFIARNSSQVRTDGVFPNPAILNWDARQLINETQNYRTNIMWERLLGATRDTGVFGYSFCHSTDNHGGDDNPSLWLPTVQATRLEIAGTTATAGNIQCVVNDVAPVALDQSQRYVETAGTGFHPNPDHPGAS